MTELRKEQQLQNDLDIPLTIFMTYSPHSPPTFEQKSLISNNSSASLRLTNTTLYQPVLEHIRTLENHIQQVISLTGQLIEKQATVDVGSFELQELCREDSYDEQQIEKFSKLKTLNVVHHFMLYHNLKHYQFQQIIINFFLVVIKSTKR